MAKFKAGFVKEYEEEKKEKEEQQRLREKHKIADENVVVVEKKHILKFIIKTLGGVIRIIASICLILLASFGLLCIIYPEPRAQGVMVLNEIIMQAKGMMGL